MTTKPSSKIPSRNINTFLGHNRYYGEMVSNLDAESKDPTLNSGGIFPENTLFDDVNYSWQYWLRGNPLNQKYQWRQESSKKVIHGNKTHQQKQRTQQKYLSDHNRFSAKNNSTVDLQSEDQNSNPGRTFLTFSFLRGCRLELTLLAKKETTQRKKNKEESSQQNS